MIKEERLNQIIEGPEVLIYMCMENLGGFIWRMNHDMAHGRIPEASHKGIDKDIVIAREEQKKLLTSLTRFGVNPTDEKGVPTKDYWKWYRWWSQWHKGMSNDDWNRVDSIMGLTMTEKQIAECRPEGKWQDYEEATS